ncbi:MAG: hypothetical protein Q8N60_01330, partial [Candidatus Diapherotrites archaeon]|nr:hypothetical protein [Candidatus Diapherotrites archaeon]
LSFLRNFPAKETKTPFELFRCSIGQSTVTLYTSGKLVAQGNDCGKAKEKILDAAGLEKEVVLGIDETGRGESFGAFVIAAVLADSSKMRELRDSKKVSNIEGKRKIVERNALAIAVFKIEAKQLDELRGEGINLNQIEVRAINAFADFFWASDKKIKILVDGSPLKGSRQGIQFIVKGDDKNAVIGAASVVAKSEREKSGKEKRLSWGKEAK